MCYTGVMNRLTNTSTHYLLWYSPSQDEYYSVAPGEALPDLSEDDEWVFHSPLERTHTLKVCIELDRISNMEHALRTNYAIAGYRY